MCPRSEVVANERNPPCRIVELKYWFASVLLLALPNLGLAQNALFDPEPTHVWNRLHRQLYARTTADGTVYAQEGLEPVFVRRSKFLTEEPSHEQALRLLDEFLEQKADALVRDPLKRAILQRDLWAVFWTTADPFLERQPQRRELQKRLTQVMRRVALTPKEIDGLPDNLGAAVMAKGFPIAYDAKHPDLPFLPNDLQQADGPWVLVRSRLRKGDTLAAPTHFDLVEGRSVFLILIRFPTGRRATEDYLKSLEDLRQRTGAIPQIPEGTQVAPLRRMMLVDSTGSLRLTPVTESLQLRVYQKLAVADMYEFRLRRQDLFAGGAGGLQPTAPDEVNYFDSGFLGLPPHASHDPLETKPFKPLNDRLSPIVMKSCIACHGAPGIFGVQSMFVDHFDQPPLGASNLEDQVSSHRNRTYKTYAWGLLQGFWEAQPHR